MRLVAGSVMVARAFEGLLHEGSLGPPAALIVRVALGLLIAAGLWTPPTGVLVGILETGLFAVRAGDPWIHLFVATIGISLSLLGPGAWSVDAWLFGWRRIDIDIRDRQGRR